MKILNIQDVIVPPNSHPVVFITGVTGQDGSHMVDYLLREEPKAFIIGGARRLSSDNHDSLKHLENEPRFQLVHFDLTDSHSVYKLTEKIRPEYFINFAAQSFVASSWDFSLQTLMSNVGGVINCLESIQKFCPNCRFYNAGSSEEFGNVSYEPQDENHPLRPRSPYGASKSSARHYVKVYRESYGLYAIQGWLFNHEGTRRGKQFVTRKISCGIAAIKKALDEYCKGDVRAILDLKPIELGNLDSKRDWSDAEDMMDAVWRMLNQEKHNKLSKEIKDYVTASGENHTIRDFVEEGFKVVGIQGKWVGSGLDERFESFLNIGEIAQPITLVKVNPVFYRPAEVDVLCGNSNLIKTELGWKPKSTFKDLVRKMVENDLRSV